MSSDAQREKFNQLYKISDSTDFEVTVLRLVVLVQNCLYIFGLFNLQDVDGLLCNATEKGLEVYYDTFLKSTFQVQSLHPSFAPCLQPPQSERQDCLDHCLSKTFIAFVEIPNAG